MPEGKKLRIRIRTANYVYVGDASSSPLCGTVCPIRSTKHNVLLSASPMW